MSDKKKIIILSLVMFFIALMTLFNLRLVWKREIGPRVFLFRKWQQEVVVTSLRNNLMLSGFLKHADENMTEGHEIFTFLGHAYPQNGYSKGPNYSSAKLMMNFFKEYVKKRNTQSVILGGDTVYDIDASSIAFLKALKESLPHAFLILGNHEWKIRTIDPESYNELFTKDFESATIDDVRFIFLNSQDENEKVTISAKQIEFLKSLAQDKEHHKLKSFIFLHHALWSDQFEGANSEGDVASKEQWQKVVIPLLKKINVEAVFAGDSGTRQMANLKKINGITHILTGWPMENIHVPNQWISLIKMKNKFVIREHAVLTNYEHYYKDHF